MLVAYLDIYMALSVRIAILTNATWMQLVLRDNTLVDQYQQEFYNLALCGILPTSLGELATKSFQHRDSLNSVASKR